ncbi:MAG: glycosyltransferase family 2 protein [Gemmatimonadaceae bacterium]
MLTLLVVAQLLAALLLLGRLSGGRRRQPPVEPVAGPGPDTTVTAIVATLNEAAHIGPCLASLSAQASPLTEILVVDSRSTDATREIVTEAGHRDSRIRLLTDPTLPDGWIGKPWALHYGLGHASGAWILTMDADTEAKPGLVGAVVSAATTQGLDAVSFSPRFTGHGDAVLWLQPALLTTLVYRFGPTGSAAPSAPTRVMANGQCFLARREALTSTGGYTPSARSFCDDVTLARHLATRGLRVAFLDGSRLYTVRSYRSLREVWREWGRSLDLKDASTPVVQWLDVFFLLLVQGLPLPILAALGVAGLQRLSPAVTALAVVNGTLVAVRVLLSFALRGAYDRVGWTFWLSPVADPLAVARIVISSATRRRRWRGRDYGVTAVEVQTPGVGAAG